MSPRTASQPVRGALAAAAILLSVAVRAAAQDASLPRTHSFEATAGLGWDRASTLDSSDASLTSSTGSVTLFSTTARAESSIGYDLRLSYSLTRALSIEAGIARRSPRLHVGIQNDLEGGRPESLSSEALRVYRIEGSVLFHLTRSLGNVVPYVVGGGGQLRLLDADSVLMQTAGTAHLGAGAKVYFFSRASGIVRGVGLRGEGRMHLDGRTIDLEHGARASFSAGLAGIVAF